MKGSKKKEKDTFFFCFCHKNKHLGNYFGHYTNAFVTNLLDGNSQWCSCRHGAKLVSLPQAETAAILVFEKLLVSFREQEKIPSSKVICTILYDY